jgi:hypothetical protein
MILAAPSKPRQVLRGRFASLDTLHDLRRAECRPSARAAMDDPEHTGLPPRAPLPLGAFPGRFPRFGRLVPHSCAECASLFDRTRAGDPHPVALHRCLHHDRAPELPPDRHPEPTTTTHQRPVNLKLVWASGPLATHRNTLVMRRSPHGAEEPTAA